MSVHIVSSIIIDRLLVPNGTGLFFFFSSFEKLLARLTHTHHALRANPNEHCTPPRQAPHQAGGAGCVNSVRAAHLDGRPCMKKQTCLASAAADDGMECIGPATTMFLVCCTLISTSTPRTPTQALRRCHRCRSTPSGRRPFLLCSVYSSPSLPLLLLPLLPPTSIIRPRREAKGLASFPSHHLITMSMNIFRLAGDMSHVFSIIILLLRLQVAKNANGVSLKTQELFLIVFCTRYLDLLIRYISLYNSAMKILYIGSTAGT